ncbi:MAG TPA: hypothetical protein VEJ84_07145 [Acidimicrobiales bacterium]|nr:hypothetical protein [Acidimicrobiales bacterium]
MVAAAITLEATPIPANAVGQLLSVCQSGPPACQYSSIQAAINAASTGATIVITTGTYSAPLNTDGKNLDLLGAGGGQTTIAASGSFEKVVEIDSGSVMLAHVTIVSDFMGGSGIYNAGTLTLNDTTVLGNASTGQTNGADILNAGTATLNDSTIADNIGESGGGIYNDGSLTLNDTTVSGNAAVAGGGIFNYGTATLNGSTVSDNTGNNPTEHALDGGGGIFNDGTLTMTLTRVTGNTLPAYFPAGGGGIFNEGTATLLLSLVSGNTSETSNGGGGIYNVNMLTLVLSAVTGNCASANADLFNGGTLKQFLSVVSGNSCPS